MSSEAAVDLLLNHVSGWLTALKTTRAAYADRVAPAFTPFEFIDTREQSLSRIFAWLLDPRGSHAQGDRFLRAFYDWLELPFPWKDAAEVSFVVRTEVPAHFDKDAGFFDVLLTAAGMGLAIENKPWAGDQPAQVARYLRDLQNRCPRAHLLLFLSGDGRQPSEHSLSTAEREMALADGRLRIRSYESLLAWLVTCRGLCAAPPVLMMIDGLIAHIRNAFMGIENMVEVDQLVDRLLSTDDKFEAALAVISTETALKARLIAKLIADVESRIASFTSWRIVRADIGPSAQTGLIVGLSNDAAYDFGVEFYRANFRYLFYGMVRREGARADRQMVKKLRAFLGKGSATPWWPYWRKVAPNDRYFPMQPDADSDFWLSLKSGEFADCIVDYVASVDAHLHGAPDPR